MSAKTRALGVAEWVACALAHYTDRLDTYVQTKAGAARYQEGPGRVPSKEEMALYRALSEVARKPR